MTHELAVTQTLMNYYRTFSTLELSAILPYFHEPAMYMGSAGVFSFPDAGAVGAVIGQTIAHLRAQGYARSEYELRQLTVLSATDAIARGVAVRFKTDGQELERVGITYLMHKAGDQWKIAVMVMHDSSGVVDTTS